MERVETPENHAAPIGAGRKQYAYAVLMPFPFSLLIFLYTGGKELPTRIEGER